MDPSSVACFHAHFLLVFFFFFCKRLLLASAFRWNNNYAFLLLLLLPCLLCGPTISNSGINYSGCEIRRATFVICQSMFKTLPTLPTAPVPTGRQGLVWPLLIQTSSFKAQNLLKCRSSTVVLPRRFHGYPGTVEQINYGSIARLTMYDQFTSNYVVLISFLYGSFYLQGYTALHIATQFGRNDIFELLCNVYSEYNMRLRCMFFLIIVFLVFLSQIRSV